jgi:pimeloyl-ACP methyl ester carboxylesterase
MSSSSSSPARDATPTRVSFHTIEADGVRMFYREAGPVNAPVVLLLHGYPTSSHMFRELIPKLATRYRVMAPDLPGFGFTTVPPERNYEYSFDALAHTAEAFVEALKLTRYALYVFDYGAPVGFRLAVPPRSFVNTREAERQPSHEFCSCVGHDLLGDAQGAGARSGVAHPERVTAIVSQNGNAYEEGLGDSWDPMRRYWATPSAENREALRNAVLTPAGTRWQYTEGVRNPEMVAPESYTLDQALMERPGNTEIQLDLFLDYASNLKLYPNFQAYFRDYKPPMLAIWGKNDPFFIPPGAEAYRRDNPNARVTLLDTGHFALETHVEEIAEAMHEFLAGAVR